MTQLITGNRIANNSITANNFATSFGGYIYDLDDISYLTDGIDILNGCLDSNNQTNQIDGNLFFNQNLTGQNFTGFTISGSSFVSPYVVAYSNSVDVGIHPFYDAVFHQILHGYNHYVVSTGSTSFFYNSANSAIILRQRKSENNINYWTSYVDNSKFTNGEKIYTLLPCDGDNKFINKKEKTTNDKTETLINTENFDIAYQNTFRCIWDDDYINNDFSGQTFPTYKEYHRSYISDKNKRK